MFNRYLILAWRRIVKERHFTLLNLVGLATGLAAALLIYIWINDETSMDKIFANDNRLFQVMKNSQGGGRILTYEWTPVPLAKALAKELPEVEAAVTVASESGTGSGDGLTGGAVKAGDKMIRARECYATGDFFRVFDYPLLAGDRNSVLNGQYAAVISDKLALRLFNTTENIVGRTIGWNKKSVFGPVLVQSYKVTGVFKAPASHSSDDYELVLPLESNTDVYKNFNDWENSNPSTFVLLKQASDYAAFSAKLTGYLENKTKDTTQGLFARRYSDRYLYNKYENGQQAGGRITYVRLFSIVAILVLIVACINFMNLSTARASGRMKEIGVSKVLGAQRGALAVQFLVESVCMALLALLLAVLFIFLFFPTFERIIGRPIPVPLNGKFIVFVFLVTIVTGLLSGSYPALYLSGFNPLSVLKGRLVRSSNESVVRRGLVVFQFTVSALLIVCVIVVSKQMNLIHRIDLGFDKENIIVFRKGSGISTDNQAFLQQLRAIPGVVEAANYSSDLIVNYTGTDLSWAGKDAYNKVTFKYLFTGYDFIETLGIKMKEGAPFSRNLEVDTSAIILNQAAVDEMGIANPVGQNVELWGRKMRIIGVTDNFHFESLYEKIKPCFFLFDPVGDKIAVRIAAGQAGGTIDRIQEFYEKSSSGIPFDYEFLDQDYRVLYASENRAAWLSQFFSAITIIISCLGLFGLAAFTAQKRQKEISIRKVIGASATNIAILMARDFLVLIVVSMLIAFPLGWWFTTRWLEGFAYRVTIGSDVYLAAAGLILLITLLTIGYQSLKSAVLNPIKSLRSE